MTVGKSILQLLVGGGADDGRGTGLIFGHGLVDVDQVAPLAHRSTVPMDHIVGGVAYPGDGGLTLGIFGQLQVQNCGGFRFQLLLVGEKIPQRIAHKALALCPIPAGAVTVS